MCYNPDQYTEPQSGLEPKSVESELADYIDNSVPAQCILNEMADQDMPLTLDLAKRVWLDVLENLHSQLEVSVDRILQRVKC